jgi:hypothetical protein
MDCWKDMMIMMVETPQIDDVSSVLLSLSHRSRFEISVVGGNFRFRFGCLCFSRSSFWRSHERARERRPDLLGDSSTILPPW